MYEEMTWCISFQENLIHTLNIYLIMELMNATIQLFNPDIINNKLNMFSQPLGTCSSLVGDGA
jgi:hypothetical protein